MTTAILPPQHGVFAPMPTRLVGELEERQAMGARSLPYCHTFLDDYLRGILPHDLVLLTAPTGIGKTQLALDIAASNAADGKRVHVFALEAEPRELERRRKFSLIAGMAFRSSHPHRFDLNYTDWLRGACEHVAEEFNAAAERVIAERYSTLHTFYRGKKFDAADLAREVGRVYERSDLIVIDHLHYIDDDADENEARALSDTVKTIRDISLRIGKPILLVAHLRKLDRKLKQLVPTIDDVHGSSNVTKIATQVITLAPAHDVKPQWDFHRPTFVAVLKDRRTGPCPFVAVQNFDARTKTYVDGYTLGTIHGAKWSELKPVEAQRIRWAKHHVPSDPQTTTDDHPNAPGAA